MQTRETKVFFMNALKISLASTTREEPLHVMFVRTHTYFENQNATKMTSAIAESHTYSSVGFITSFCHWAATLPMQKLLLCGSVQLTTPLPRVSCPDDCKNNEERAFMLWSTHAEKPWLIKPTPSIFCMSTTCSHYHA